MNDLICDIGYKSVNHVGEQLCGDHVEVVEQEDGSQIIVLADGMGSGVKASILSTLLVDECNKLYGGEPGDDATSCVVRIRKRIPMNLLFGRAVGSTQEDGQAHQGQLLLKRNGA